VTPPRALPVVWTNLSALDVLVPGALHLIGGGGGAPDEAVGEARLSDAGLRHRAGKRIDGGGNDGSVLVRDPSFGRRRTTPRQRIAGCRPMSRGDWLPDRPDAAKLVSANEKSMKRQPERRPVVHFHRLASCLSR
jgi:hypothetical protein